MEWDSRWGLRERILLREGNGSHIFTLLGSYFGLGFFSDLIFSLLRFSGTIVRVEDISSQWTDSKWRSLKVMTKWKFFPSLIEFRLQQYCPDFLNLFHPLGSMGRTCFCSKARQSFPMGDWIVCTVYNSERNRVSIGEEQKASTDCWDSCSWYSSKTLLLASFLLFCCRYHSIYESWVANVFSFIIVDTAGQALHDAGLMQSCDATQPSVFIEGKRSDNHVIWHHKQTNVNTSSGSMPWPQTEGDRQFSSNVSGWPLLSSSTMHSPKPRNEPKVELGEKPERPTSCRLFGIDLINHSSNSQQLDKLTVQPLNGSSGGNEAHTPGILSAADMQQKSVVLKTSKEITHWQSVVSPKEIRSKQSSTSARSRTKVPTLWLTIWANIIYINYTVIVCFLYIVYLSPTFGLAWICARRFKCKE